MGSCAGSLAWLPERPQRVGLLAGARPQTHLHDRSIARWETAAGDQPALVSPCMAFMAFLRGVTGFVLEQSGITCISVCGISTVGCSSETLQPRRALLLSAHSPCCGGLASCWEVRQRGRSALLALQDAPTCFAARRSPPPLRQPHGPNPLPPCLQQAAGRAAWRRSQQRWTGQNQLHSTWVMARWRTSLMWLLCTGPAACACRHTATSWHSRAASCGTCFCRCGAKPAGASARRMRQAGRAPAVVRVVRGRWLVALLDAGAGLVVCSPCRPPL